MSVNIMNGLEAVNQIMKGCIEKEMLPGGLLEDVETFIPIYHNESGVDEPCIWMTQHPTRADRQADLSQTMDLVIPFEFDCVVYANDLEESELAGQNLATRVILAITRNYLLVQSDLIHKRIIKRIELETYYPVGQVQIQGKSDRVPATGVILNVIHTINWKMCCRNLEQNQNNEGD